MINVLSLCDGMGTGKLAFDELGIETNYYAIEIDKYARDLASANLKGLNRPVNDILEIKTRDILMGWPKFDYILFGAPCQSLSISGDGSNFDGKSKLFFDCMNVLALAKYRNPDIKFLIENVASMRPEPRNQMDRTIGAGHRLINSSSFSAQIRKRLYWFNWECSIPTDPNEDKLNNILDKSDKKEMAFAWSKSCRTNGSFDERIRHDDKSNTLTCSLSGTESRVIVTDKDLSEFKPRKVWNRRDLLIYNIEHRVLSVNEVAKLQTIPSWYDFSMISKTQAYKCLGNGWTLEVIKHLIKASL